MSRQLEFQEILETLLGSHNVYFQPPSTVKIKYPCIIYARSAMDVVFADNYIYKFKQAYLVTVIDPNPDSDILEKMLLLPFCRFVRHYTADNLNHDVYNVYY